MSSALALDRPLARAPRCRAASNGSPRTSPVSGAPRTDGRTDRHWERSSECRGALRFCAMAETFTMTEGEEAARWGMGRRIFAKSKLARGPASSHVAMLPSTNSLVEGCERHLCSYRWPADADAELTVSEDIDRPYLAHPTLSPPRSCPSSACYVPRIPHTRTRRTRR